MKIVKNSELKEYLNDKNKIVGVVEVGGSLHEGHEFFINEVKKQVDILILVYFSWLHPSINYYNTGLWLENEVFPFEEFLKSNLNLFENKNIDFLVNSPLTDYIKNEVTVNKKHIEQIYKYCENLGIGGKLSYPVILSPILDKELKELKNLNYYLGSKNILVDIIARKLLNSQEIYNPKYIWKSLRNKKTFEIITRLSNRKVFGLIIKLIYDELILKGKIDNNKIDEIKNQYSYILNLNIPIIDLITIKKIDSSSDNCIIVCNDYSCYDYLFIKNGEIIF